jgi:hypothetical protein
MTSALAALANATAVFTLPTVGVTTDADTGNVLPVTEEVSVTLYLRRFGFLENVRQLPGVVVGDETYQGYAVEPQALDARIKPGITGMLTFGDEDPLPCEVLVARFDYGSAGLIGKTLQDVLGDQIRLARYVQRG